MSVDIMNSVHVDQQGNFIAKSFQKLEIKDPKREELKENEKPEVNGTRKSSSAVFSWPMFINKSVAKEIMKPVRNPLTVRSSDSVRSILWTLIKNKIQGVPVYHETTRKYMGFVDMFALVQYISIAAGSAIVKPDFFQVFKRQTFGDAQISKVLTSKDNCTAVTESSSLGALFDVTVATNLSHIPVMNKQKVMGLISQARMVQYLADNIHNLGGLASKRVMDLNLSGMDNVYTISDKVPTITAFAYMIEKGVRGLAVVNADGKFVDAISSFDVKGLVYGDFFSDLRQPVLHYLSKARILLGKNLAPVVCSTSDTLAVALQKMALEGVSRIFVVDSDRNPIQVISLRDILKVLHANPKVAEPLKPLAMGGASQ